jgi:serine/threonine-protein kinase RsbW
MILKMILNLPSDAAYVPIVRALSATLMEQLGIVQQDVDAASLVIGEVCANVVRHAHIDPHTHYSVGVDYAAEHIDITVIDQGKGFDPRAVAEPDLERAGGWGIWLVENLTERVEFEVVPGGGTTVSARIRVHYRDEAYRRKAGEMDRDGHEESGIMLTADPTATA